MKLARAGLTLGLLFWSAVRFIFFPIALGLPAGNFPMQAQSISFVREFTTPGIEQATTVTTDSSGTYVLGYRRFGGLGVRAGVRKYDSLGNELWSREFSVPPPGDPQVVRAAADATGIYIVVWSNQSIRKYSPTGDELWTRQLGFRPLGGVTVDRTGIYVAGRDFIDGDYSPYSHPNAEYLRKFNSDGAEVWTRRWGEPNTGGIPSAVAADATGVYVLGSDKARKYDSSGNELWIRQLDAKPRIPPHAAAAADRDGFYVVGVTGASSPYLRKYDAGGNELWTRPLTTSSYNVYPGGITADASGVYVAGTTDFVGRALPGQCRSGSAVDSFVRKYDPEGTELWTREFSTADAVWANDVVVDSGSVYVVGKAGSGMDEWYYSTPAPPTGAFFAKFENAPAAVARLRPHIFPDCVVNAASYVGGGVAPGEIVTLFGSAIGPPEAARPSLNEDRRLSTTLSGTRIFFNGVPAPLLYVSDTQSSAIVPYALAGRTSVDVEVEYKGVRSDALTVPVLTSRPGIFSLDGSGRGPGAILNEDGSFNSPSNPARRGSIITIFGTGGGEADSGVVDGQLLGSTLPRTSLPVSVIFDFRLDDEFGNGPKPGDVLYAGGSTGSVAGLLQVNVRVPANTMVTGDAVPFALVIGSHWEAYRVTVALR